MGVAIARRAATNQRLLKHSCEALLGISAGLLADGELGDKESLCFDSWLRDHDSIAAIWPEEVIVARVRAVLASGILTEEERAYLEDALATQLGGTLEETGTTSRLATWRPIGGIEAIAVADRLFCFTALPRSRKASLPLPFLSVLQRFPQLIQGITLLHDGYRILGIACCADCGSYRTPLGGFLGLPNVGG